jgi:hypothetical protein
MKIQIDLTESELERLDLIAKRSRTTREGVLRVLLLVVDELAASTGEEFTGEHVIALECAVTRKRVTPADVCEAHSGHFSTIAVRQALGDLTRWEYLRTTPRGYVSTLKAHAWAALARERAAVEAPADGAEGER